MNTLEMLTEEIFKIIDDIIYEDNVKETMSDYPSKVIFNPPATIVIFNDGTKIISKCDKEDKFSKGTGFLMCMLKRNYGNAIAHKMLEKFVYSKERSVKEDVKKIPKSKKNK